jgi:ribose-phosphate pyrophosphokinase
MDLHSDQIQGFFNIPVDHLYASAIFVPYIRKFPRNDLVMASADAGGAGRAGKYASFLNCEMVVCYKNRVKANEIKEMKLIGDVRGKNVVLVDDIIDTAGTITRAADLMMENGAKSVRALCSHPVLSGYAYELIEKSALTELIVTDSIPLAHPSKKIKVLSVADLFSDVIQRVLNDESVSSLFQVTC